MRTAACALAVALTAAAPAHAFCGFFVGKADSQLFNKSSQVAIVRDGNRTVITMGNDFKGEMDEFALVVPVPSVLTREQIHVGERRLLVYSAHPAEQAHRPAIDVRPGGGRPRRAPRPEQALQRVRHDHERVEARVLDKRRALQASQPSFRQGAKAFSTPSSAGASSG